MRFVALAAMVVAALAAMAPHAPQGDIAGLLNRASVWAVRFEHELSGLLFRERSRQDTEGRSVAGSVPSAWAGIRTVPSGGHSLALEANVFLIKPRGASRFVVYRDTYRVGPNTLTDHTDRLGELLLSADDAAIDQVRRLTDASARYNIGPVARNTNVPTMAFEYLKPEHIAGLRVRQTGGETFEGRAIAVVEFEEIARPTIVRGEGNSDAPARGRYWIDPETGAVPRAVVELAAADYTGRLDVTVSRDARLDVWVPRVMKESWLSGQVGIKSTARYDRFQRLAVATDEIIK